MATGETVSTFVHHEEGRVVYLVKLDDGLLASGADDGVNVWNVATGECVSTFVGHEGIVCALAKLDGGLLASGAEDGLVKVWMPSGEFDFL